GMNSRKVDRGLIRRDGNAKVTERIKGNGRPDELPRSRVEDWVRLIHNPIEARNRDLRSSLRILDSAITKARIITPGAVKQAIDFHTDGSEKGIRLIVE